MNTKQSLRVLIAALMLLALACAPALAKTVSPGSDFYYLDDADVLSEALEGEIFFSNKLLYDACGAQIVVVTVNSTGREAIDDYAYDLFNSWGIGDVSKNNGFLILLAIDDDDYYALPGSGLDSRFSAGTIKSYYDQYLEKDFAAKNYEAGVKKLFEAVFERIADTYNAEVTPADGVAAYQAYLAENAGADDYGGYNGTRRMDARGNNSYRDDEDEGIGFGFVLVVLLIIVLVVLMSKGRRARRRSGVMPPPPPAVGFGRTDYRPTHTVYHGSGYRPSSSGGSGLFGGLSSGGGHASSSSRSSFGGGSSRSSFGGGSSRSSFGGSSRSSGFGGGHSGGGGSRGGGAGRGRH